MCNLSNWFVETARLLPTETKRSKIVTNYYIKTMLHENDDEMSKPEKSIALEMPTKYGEQM